MVKGSDLKTACPRCQSFELRHWDELNDDQRILADKLPASAEYSKAERKKHRFCTRCWFEETVESDHLA